MSEFAPEHRPPRNLRSAGFLCASVGALLAGVGALLPWVTTAISGVPTEVSPTYVGVDLPDGIIVIVLALVMLVAALMTRAGTGDAARRGMAAVVIVSSFLIVGIAGASIVTADGRFESTAVDDVVDDLTPQGATDEQRARIDDLLELRIGPGPWLALVGGVIGAVGGVLTLAWASPSTRQERAEAS